MHGDIVYIELALQRDKLNQTKSFYEKLFGWTFQESFLTEKKYFMFQTPGKKLSGALDENVQASIHGTQMYVEVDFIESIFSQLPLFPEAYILKDKTFISKEYGHYALIVDPSGNRIGLQEDSKE